jgi:hypothetical protein
VARWPVREGLLAFQRLERERSLEQYRHELTVWALIAPHSKKKLKPPAIPAALKKDPHGRS